MASERWISMASRKPPQSVVVETKIADAEYGERNVQTLRRVGNLFYEPSGHMYVYYTPTHWRPIPEEAPDER